MSDSLTYLTLGRTLVATIETRPSQGKQVRILCGAAAVFECFSQGESPATEQSGRREETEGKPSNSSVRRPAGCGVVTEQRFIVRYG